jgi:hypothetical protein
VTAAAAAVIWVATDQVCHCNTVQQGVVLLLLVLLWLLFWQGLGPGSADPMGVLVTE